MTPPKRCEHRRFPNADLAGSHRARPGLGTAAYMAPEQAKGRVSTNARTSGRLAVCCSRDAERSPRR